MKISMLILILSFIFVFSCEKDKSIIESGPTGSYSYTSFDTLGTVLVTGWFKFEFIDTLQIEGSWHLERFGIQDNIGPQVGNGELAGTVNNSSISINLNPQIADNNVFLDGTIKNNNIEGKWYWSTFAGAANWGIFTATKD